MTTEEKQAMWDKSLKLNPLDRTELHVKKFLKSPLAPPVVVVTALAALEVSARVIESVGNSL